MGQVNGFYRSTAVAIGPKADILRTACQTSSPSALCGLEVMRLRRAYAHAIEAGYRFYSYGEACLLFGDLRAGLDRA